jgi:hypothetical protein
VSREWTLRAGEFSFSNSKIIDKTEGEYDPSAPLLRLFARPGTGRIKIKNPRQWQAPSPAFLHNDRDR